MPIRWEECLVLNIKEIDEQHKWFFDTYKKIDAISMFNSDPILQAKKYFKYFLELRTSIFLHFHTEERYMMKYKFKNIINHMELHNSFLRKLETFMDEFIKSFHRLAQEPHKGAHILEMQSCAKQIINYLYNWLTMHIKGEDRKIMINEKNKSMF